MSSHGVQRHGRPSGSRSDGAPVLDQRFAEPVLRLSQQDLSELGGGCPQQGDVANADVRRTNRSDPILTVPSRNSRLGEGLGQVPVGELFQRRRKFYGVVPIGAVVVPECAAPSQESPPGRGLGWLKGALDTGQAVPGAVGSAPLTYAAGSASAWVSAKSGDGPVGCSGCSVCSVCSTSTPGSGGGHRWRRVGLGVRQVRGCVRRRIWRPIIDPQDLPVRRCAHAGSARHSCSGTHCGRSGPVGCQWRAGWAGMVALLARPRGVPSRRRRASSYGGAAG